MSDVDEYVHLGFTHFPRTDDSVSQSNSSAILYVQSMAAQHNFWLKFVQSGAASIWQDACAIIQLQWDWEHILC